MAATAALASTAASSSSAASLEDADDENDTIDNDPSSELLAERLALARLGDDDDNDDAKPMGFFIDPSSSNGDDDDDDNDDNDDNNDLPPRLSSSKQINNSPLQLHSPNSRRNTEGLPPWPSTPPPRPSPLAAGNDDHAHHRRYPASCPRPSSSSSANNQSPPSRGLRDHRPLFVSSSSGALRPPQRMETTEVEVEIEDQEEEDQDMGPASRAAAALRLLENATYDDDDGETDNDKHKRPAPWEMNGDNDAIAERKEGSSAGTLATHPSQSSSVDISRQETLLTSHRSDERIVALSPRRRKGSSNNEQQRTTFDAYPSKANEPIPTSSNSDDLDEESDLYLRAFSPDHLSGRILSSLSLRFVPPSKRHIHGGSALAGFLALLLVTCANYMLGPMRDAAALAVGVSHIPALTLASTVLALGSSVPVGWLFEAPNPMRRRVWRRMGLTRGETQGTSLALFYRVFAFLLLSYALGFKLVDKFGRNNNGRDGETMDGSGAGEEEEGEEASSAIALIATFLLRLLMGIGLPVDRILNSLEGRSGGILGTLGMQQRILPLADTIAASLELHANESVPSLFLRACGGVVNRFGKVIYVMFFLVVHLMKLHSLSLIWGVTTEAMEYEETAEKRRAEKRTTGRRKRRSDDDEDDGDCANDDDGEGDRKSKSTSSNGSSSPRPSKSSVRLKRLGFVGFGGTLGGILGSMIASFAAQILNMSGLLILAAILLEISANLSIELGRIMQRHWEEQMRHLSCCDLASLASGDSLASGQQQQVAASVDSSMRKSVSLGSMKRIASAGRLSSTNIANLAAASQQQKSGGAGRSDNGGMTRARSIGNISLASEEKAKMDNDAQPNGQGGEPPLIDDNSFKQRLLRGFTTILQSRLLMSIFTYNALYASTSVLLSFQRAELVANRSSSASSNSALSNTAFLAKINTASSVAVFALQASGLGAYVANGCGQRGALALMPIIRLCGVILLGWWHLISGGQPPDLILFLVIDEFTKVINFAIAKPVRENLWRGLSAEARYEAKPIVDTLANRWGGGSAAFFVSFISRITDLTGLGVVNEQNGERSIFGFPPVLLLCMIISAWWTAVSADVGNIRRKIDLELKKQQ